MAAIELISVGKRYRVQHQRPSLIRDVLPQLVRPGHVAEFWALRDISLSIEPGEVVGVLGRNGSGKSTLLKVIAGITPPTEGRVNVDGKISALLEIGAGFQGELTGIENVYLNGMLLGMTREEVKAKLDSILAFAEIGDFADAHLKTYSTGMCVRLGFSVAAHVDFDVLLLDEVLAVGDAPFQTKCRARMNEFRKAGKTIVLVSHSLDTISEFCDRAVWLEEGKLHRAAPAPAVVESYSAYCRTAAPLCFSRRRVLDALACRESDRMAMSMIVYSDRVRERMAARNGSIGAFCRELGIDLVHTLGPRPTADKFPDPQSAVAAKFVDPRDPALCRTAGDFIREHREERAVMVQTWGVVEAASEMLSPLAVLEAMKSSPAELRTLFDRIADWNIEMLAQLQEIGADVIHLSDDWAGNSGPLFGMREWKELVLPPTTRIVTAARQRGLRVSLHTDGNVTCLMDDIVAMGVQSLHPVSRSAGMDMRALKKKYAGRLCLHGGLDICHTLPDASDAELTAEIQSLIGAMAPGGGFIFSASHSIEPEVSLDRVAAAYRIAARCARAACRR